MESFKGELSLVGIFIEFSIINPFPHVTKYFKNGYSMDVHLLFKKCTIQVKVKGFLIQLLINPKPMYPL